MTDSSPHTQRIGAYPIEREIGRGGMGIVYLGRDTRLDRPVAIKVLPDAVAGDAERLQRFEREARLLASLTHPNIASIYGIEESSGRRFLVLEYVEGETLAQRIAHGPLPVDETVDVGRQIAAALEAAHEGGVIHRDLKPGNVKLTPAGDVKVLDFGLAKGGSGSGVSSDPSISASPTMALTGATAAGVILGTAAYMSPEQARGRSLDRRTDIWSFGCVLYECLTGRQAFAGETVSDVIASILQGEPDWKALPASTPPRLRELIARCLTKDAKKRLRDIGEARLLLEGSDVSSASGVFAAAGAAAPPPSASKLAPALAILFAFSTAALAAVLLLAPKPEPAPVRRLLVDAPEMVSPPRDPAPLSLSPDGSLLVISAADSIGGTRLWMRSLDALEGRILPGTEDGAFCAWSPEGQSILFSTQDKLKKLDLRGGTPEVIGQVASYGRGQSWGSRGVVVYAGGPSGPLAQIPAAGGTATPASTLDSAETGHRFPRFLPDGRHFLYCALPPRGREYSVFVGRTGDPRWRESLMKADGTPVFVEPGWLLYTRNDRVMAQRFDPGARKRIGEPIALADAPSHTTYLGSPSVLAGLRGPMAYYQQQNDLVRICWVPRGGREVEPLPVPPGGYEALTLTRDGELAVTVRRASSEESDLWLLDLARSNLTRFTFGPGRADRPVCSPNGELVVYASDRKGRWDIYVKRIGTGGSGEVVVEGGSQIKYPSTFTPDGRTLIYDHLDEKNGWDVRAVDLEGDRTPRPVLNSVADEQFAELSRDGRWLAFTSNESGRNEVFVASYPDLGHRRQLSTSGGTFAKWRADGRELAFLSGEGLAYVGFDPATGKPTGNVRVAPLNKGVIGGVMSPDLARALALVVDPNAGGGNAVTIVDHWRNELKRR